MAVFPSLCAPQKDQSGSAADWRPPRSVATRKTTGDLATRRGAGDPDTADGGIRMRRPEKRDPSRQTLSLSTMILVGEAE